MKVLYFTQLFYPLLFGGGEYLFFMVARELVKRGHEVHVVTQRTRGTASFEEYEGIAIHRVGREIDYTGTLPPTVSSNLEFVTRAALEGRRAISQARAAGTPFDIVHSNTYTPALSGHICAKLYGIPHIITFHDVYQASDTKFWAQWMAKLSGGIPFYSSTLAKLIEKVVMKLDVSAFHTVSDASREDLIRFGVSPEKIAVIPNGIDPADYNLGRHHMPAGRRTAVYVGRLVFYKNLETVIQAFSEVVRSVPDAELNILGDGPSREKLIELALPLKGRVTFKGRVSQEEKVRSIRESSFMVFPSVMEGFGIAAIEGFACQKPVLVSDVRPLSDIVVDGRSGFVIPPFNASAWSEKMIYLFTNPSRTEEMGDAGLQDFESNYTISHVVDRIERLYEQERRQFR